MSRTHLAMQAAIRLPTDRICSISLRMLKSSRLSCGPSFSASLTCKKWMQLKLFVIGVLQRLLQVRHLGEPDSRSGACAKHLPCRVALS